MTHEHLDALDQIHIGLALWITLAYLAIPFTALRRLPMPRSARAAGMIFFITCAVTHVAVAAGFHESRGMVLNDLAQAISATVFIWSAARMVDFALKKRAAARTPEGPTP